MSLESPPSYPRHTSDLLNKRDNENQGQQATRIFLQYVTVVKKRYIIKGKTDLSRGDTIEKIKFA